jgi:AcrR family transcriptional regulator
MAALRTRADAARNSARVVQAAAEVMAEKGLEAGVPEIAARAGVGRATVYRCYPTKEHLIAAVVLERLEWIAERVRGAVARPDAWDAFVELLEEMAEEQASDCSFAGGMGHATGLPEVVEARAALRDSIEVLLARARAEGRMREDVTADDVRVLFTGMAHVLRADGVREPERWRRQARLIAAALRAT